MHMNIHGPRRASHTYTQKLAGSCETVFALLCPVREADWLESWAPVWVASGTGVAERDCVFVTCGNAGDEAIWYITRHEPGAGVLEMLKVTPGVTACRILIEVRPAARGSEAEITYTHTSLGARGDAFVDSFTAQAYLEFMREWEDRFNFYLRNGKALRHAAN
jgi:hypothetical protein